MRKKSQPRRQSTDQVERLNLFPFLGLVVVLVPMLLLISVFIKIGVINASIRKSSIPSDEQVEESLNLTVGISEAGFTVAATGGVLPAVGEGGTGTHTIPARRGGRCEDTGQASCRDGEVCEEQCGPGNICRSKSCVVFDYMSLYNLMNRVKDTYPEQSVVNLSGDHDIPYGTLIATMDSIRFRLPARSYSEAAEFLEASPVQGEDGKYDELFPDVVMTVVE